MPCHVVSRRVVSCRAMSCHVMSCVTSCQGAPLARCNPSRILFYFGKWEDVNGPNNKSTKLSTWGLGQRCKHPNLIWKFGTLPRDLVNLNLAPQTRLACGPKPGEGGGQDYNVGPQPSPTFGFYSRRQNPAVCIEILRKHDFFYFCSRTNGFFMGNLGCFGRNPPED